MYVSKCQHTSGALSAAIIRIIVGDSQDQPWHNTHSKPRAKQNKTKQNNKQKHDKYKIEFKSL